MNHRQVVISVAFPARDQAAEVLQPGEQSLHAPASPHATQAASILGGLAAAIVTVRSNQLHPIVRAQPARQRSAVVGFVTDQSFWRCTEEAVLNRGFDQPDLMRASAGHVHGERKTMAVCNRHDVAAFSATIIADSRAPFLALLKLPSMNASDKSSLPRSRKSSASFCRIR